MTIKNNTRYFLVSFISGISILGVISLIVFLFVNPMGAKKEISVKNQSVYTPKYEDEITVLTSLDDGEVFIVGRFIPREGEISLISMPKNTLVNVIGEKQSLSEVYKRTSITGVKKAFKSTFGINIDNYIKISSQNFSKIIDVTGDFDFDVPKNVNIESDTIVININKGKQRLNSSMVYDLVTYKKYDGGEIERCNIISNIICGIINNNINIVDTDDANKVFMSIVNLMDTDISFYDFEARKSSLKFLAKFKENPATFIPMTKKQVIAGNIQVEDKTTALVKDVLA